MLMIRRAAAATEKRRRSERAEREKEKGKVYKLKYKCDAHGRSDECEVWRWGEKKKRELTRAASPQLVELA